ncbi:EthD domain-containing protein [Sphingobium sp. ZW T5_29]|uniref:EthD domain-containing protein n=1 Tax=Sphingobium sp. ZW T5_29 TaxID=3378077 RepID=UPI003854D30D
MTKSICALVHRPNSTRAAFHAYYEDRHAPLGARHFPFTRYARNHIVGGDVPDYDTISEFWADDIAAAAALMNGPVGDIMRADEEKFMDRSRIASAGVEEYALSSGEPATADGARTAFLIDIAGDRVEGCEHILSWARMVALENAGMSLDFTNSWGDPQFPAAAVLWMPGHVQLSDPPTGATVRRLILHRVETPAAQLLSSR